jgi:predicted PurR-regulated permease PerM
MYIIVQQIESHVIYPLVMQKVLDIPPIVVILALVVGAKAGGFLGVLISVPVAVALTEIMNDIGRNRILAREKFSQQQESYIA